MDTSLLTEGLESSNPSLPVIQKTPYGDTVFYTDKYLYSKINPSKNIQNTIENLLIKPETLIICVSPLLGYGLIELLEKIPPSCFILGLEADENLMKLSSTSISSFIFSHPQFKLVRTTSISLLLECIHQLPLFPFRRCIRIDMSAILPVHNHFYTQAIQEIEMTFNQWWKNHITVMKLGRNYIKNFFHNIGLLHLAVPLESLQQEKTIFIAGAGPSLDTSIDFIKKYRQHIFIISVDAAIQPLLANEITPDCLLVAESQYWIEKMFIGVKGTKIPVIADLTSRTQALKISYGSVSFFFTKYTTSSFLSKFEHTKLKPYSIEPLGSVGLIALQISDFLSHNSAVLFSGLDFSWQKAYTHSKEANQARDIRNTCNRFNPMTGAIKTQFITLEKNKDGKEVFTNHIMKSYSMLSKALASTFNNKFFDLSSTSLDNGFPTISKEVAASIVLEEKKIRIIDCGMNKVNKEDCASFLHNELTKLETLRRFLTNSKIPKDENTSFEELLKECDFLYLHYPDSYRGYSLETDFLKRIRIEIDYMIKTIRYPSF